MLISQWLQQADSKLRSNGIGTSRLDSLILLEDALNLDRVHILAYSDTELSTEIQGKLNKLLTRRAHHEPMAYIRRHTEFYGYDFVITPSVLVPRPESETMIELLKAIVNDYGDIESGQINLKKIRIADVGAGCGVLGITAQLELPLSIVDLLEIDQNALKIAQINVDKFTLSMSVIHSDLLNKTRTLYDLLLCNLPYVPDDFPINESAALEPEIAIYGGPDGLNIYRKLFQQVICLKKRPLFILTESLPHQHMELANIAMNSGYFLLIKDDFIQAFKLTSDI